MTRICDYEGSQYRTEFWERQDRRYEDLAERIAIGRMLPSSGGRIIEVGAGFGRLIDLYQRYQQIVVMDYARTQLEEAQRYLGQDDRFIFVVADVYKMPFADNLFDALVMVRVMHHMANVPAALGEIQRITNGGGAAIIEHANKRHLKAILRWRLKRQGWNPFDRAPHEFVDLNFDFHPAWMREKFAKAGLTIQATRTVSHFRLPLLKQLISPGLLAKFDGVVQPTGRWFQYTPSIFHLATPDKPPQKNVSQFFKCPACHSASFENHPDYLICPSCNSYWAFRDNIYDFKTPLNPSI